MHPNTTPLFGKPDEWMLLAVIVGAPLFGAFFNGVFGKRLGKPAVRIMALTAIGISLLAAIYTVFQLHELRHHAEAIAIEAWKTAHAGQQMPHEIPVPPTKLSWLAWKWMSMASSAPEGRMGVDVKFSVDELSAVMMLVVTGVGFLIHLYSTSYMAKDPGYHRFFAYLNLFVFAMLTLILADNMVLMFVGWEGVGACSYLLIGFWYEKGENAAAGRKAFIANRVGDVGIIGGILLLAHYTNAIDWDGINAGANGLLDAGARIILWQSAGKPPITVSPATVACLALFLGCTGKSAQIPLYVWLPDAMAGPTPVSALIHAATMVTSGLYLICRLNLVFSFSPFAMMVIAITGAATALFAATIALVQNDIKKVLAYSTVSQLGFMFLGVGVGAFGMGFFHVFTHAFFKACLFLGAGSVIHAMHARIHDDVKSQDMRNMGGLKKYLPWTYASMGAATLAIAGMPFTSGFFSKDGILFHVFANRVVHPDVSVANERLKICADKGIMASAECKRWAEHAATHFEAPRWLGPALFVVGIVAATMTAFYMFRLLFKTFWGEFQGWKVDHAAELAVNPFENEEPLEDGVGGHGAAHAHVHAHVDDDHAHDHDDHGPTDPHDLIAGDRGGVAHEDEDHHDHHEEDLSEPAAPPAEAPWTMAIPVAILGAFAIFAGFLYAEPLHFEPLGHFLSPIFLASDHNAAARLLDHDTPQALFRLREGAEKLEWPLMLPGVLAFAAGAGLAWLWYVKEGGKKPRAFAAEYPRLHRAAYNKWYVDEIYEATVIGGADALADGAALMDTWIVDGIIAKLSPLIVSGFGTILRAFQNGVVHVYAGAIALGSLGMFLFFVQPHADVTLVKEGEQFTIEAAPGVGYEYKWDLGDGKAEAQFATGDTALKRTVVLPEGSASKTITLEVKNAFGRTATRSFELGNPKPAPSGSNMPLGLPGQKPPMPNPSGPKQPGIPTPRPLPKGH